MLAQKFIHFHIAKTGGKSLESLFRQTEHTILNFRPNRQEDFIEKARDIRPDIITGHLSGAYKKTRLEMYEEHNFITVIRNPVDRFLSFYNYVKTRKATALYEKFQYLTADDALEYCAEIGSDFVRNSQTENIVWGRDESVEQVIQKNYLAVGCLEKIDDLSLFLFEKNYLFGEARVLPKLNVSGRDGDLSPSSQRRLETLTEHDMALFHLVYPEGVISTEV